MLILPFGGVPEMVGASRMVMVKTRETVIPAVAVTVKLKLPASVGVPLIKPAGFSTKPGGTFGDVQVGVPLKPAAWRSEEHTSELQSH